MRKVTLLGTLLALALVGQAQALTVASQDMLSASDTQLVQSASLGTSVARVFVDPTHPLESYDAAVAARVDAGMRVQVVVGGLGAGPLPSPAQAAAVVRRWPNLYSVSFGNELELSGQIHGWCAFRTQWRRLYTAAKLAGAKKVLFGEFSPHKTTTLVAMLSACGPITADGFAWHAYDWGGGEGTVTKLRRIARLVHQAKLRTSRGKPVPLYITEYGQLTRGPCSASPDLAAYRWSRAFALAGRFHVRELLVYGVHPEYGNWDTSVMDEWGTRTVVGDEIGRLAAASR